MITYGVLIFLGGTEYIQKIGSAMQYVGINFGYEFFGFLAALTEIVGGLMLILGAYYRASCFALTLVMTMATLYQRAALPEGHSFADFVSAGGLYPLSMGAIFISMLFIGPGRLSIQKE